MQSKEEQFDS
nr:unnamed protein product [Callosobruchus chinensis]